MPDPLAPLHQEKRRYPRLEHKIPLKISGDHGEIIAETKNISCCGTFCRIDQRLEPMTKLSIHLLLPSDKKGKAAAKRVACHGVVVRVVAVADDGDHFDTAIFFNDIAPKSIRVISEFIENMTEKNDHGKYN